MSGRRLLPVAIAFVALIASLAWNAYQFRLIYQYKTHAHRVEQRVIDAATEAFQAYYFDAAHEQVNLDAFITQVRYFPADDSAIVSFRTRPLEGGTLHTIYAFKVSNTISAAFDHLESSGSY